MQTNPTKTLSLLAIVMITITSVDSVRNLPATALFGPALIFFFLLAGLCFLIPSAMVSAELSSSWPKTGGIYIWAKTAFGEKTALFAIWFQWVSNVIWYPTILSFLAGTCAYIISPELAENKFYLASVIILIFWFLTFLNLRGIQSSARFSIFCGITGLVLPISLIIILGFIWVGTGHDLAINFTKESIIPNFHEPSMLVSLTGIILTFCGMEIATVHAQDAKNPKRDYPRALLLSVIFIIVTMLLASLSIAITIPKNNLSLVAGVMQAFKAYFTEEHLLWLEPVVAVAIVIGTLGSISNWIISPSRGLLIAMTDMQVASHLCRKNKKDMPVNLLIWQAILVTGLACLYLFEPTINTSYWMLTAMSSQLYMGMYIIMFASAIVLRYKYPDIERQFKVPGKKLGIWLVCSIAILTCAFTVVIGFAPPAEIKITSLQNYETTIISILFLLSCPPLVMCFWRALKNRK